jgi:hypothetical protein
VNRVFARCLLASDPIASSSLDSITASQPRINKREGIRFDEALERWHRLLLADSDLAFCQRRLVCGFHLLRHALDGLLCELPDPLAVPDELIPPVLQSFLFVDSYWYTKGARQILQSAARVVQAQSVIIAFGSS